MPTPALLGYLRTPLLFTACAAVALLPLLAGSSAGAEETEPEDERHVEYLQEHYPHMAPEDIDWDGASQATPPADLQPVIDDRSLIMSTCTVGHHEGDDGGATYQVGVNQTGESSWLQATTDCPDDVVQEVRTFVAILHAPAGFGDAKTTDDKDSGYPSAFAETRQTVAWYTFDAVYYGPPTQVTFCFVWGYLDSDTNLHWRHNVARVRPGVGNWSWQGWENGRC